MSFFGRRYSDVNKTELSKLLQYSYLPFVPIWKKWSLIQHPRSRHINTFDLDLAEQVTIHPHPLYVIMLPSSENESNIKSIAWTPPVEYPSSN